MRLRFGFVLLLLSLAACQPKDPLENSILFRFEDSHQTSFYAQTSNAAVIAKVRAQLALPLKARLLHPNGGIAAGDGGINGSRPWHYLKDGWDLAEASIELCDGNVELLEAALDYWLNTVKSFCPWGAKVVEEMQ